MLLSVARSTPKKKCRCEVAQKVLSINVIWYRVPGRGIDGVPSTTVSSPLAESDYDQQDATKEEKLSHLDSIVPTESVQDQERHPRTQHQSTFFAQSQTSHKDGGGGAAVSALCCWCSTILLRYEVERGCRFKRPLHLTN
jgi:hypothetical protein